MSVLKKLMQARIALQGKELKKSGHNKFAGYLYFELGDFLPVVQNIFTEIGLAGVVSYGNEIATLTITDVEDGSSVEITSPMSSAALKGCHEVQNLGAVQTYIRRYLWVTAMEIVEHDALDATTGSGDKKGPKITPTAGAMEALPEETQEALREMAIEIIAFGEADNIQAAVRTMEDAGLGQDEKVALWSLLPSKIRSAIKKFMDTERKSA